MAHDTIHTTVGQVEASVSGQGTPVLILHGSPGGIDGARAMSRFLLDQDGFRVIRPSRPGYLGTPLRKEHRSIDDEADLLATLLDALEIPEVGVLAWSGGGPAAYRFAIRHPTRIFAVVAVAAVSSAWVAPETGLAERFMFGTKLGGWVVKLISSLSPGHVVQEALQGEGSLRGNELRVLAEQVNADPAQRRLVLETAWTVNVSGRRREGWLNDVANFASIEDLELERVQCPVLLVHGDADTDAPLHYSETAHARLPSSELVVMPRGTHLSFYAHPQATVVQERARRWLLDHADSPAM